MVLNLKLAIHFNASITFLLHVLENLKKYHKGDFAGHCFILVELSHFQLLRHKGNVGGNIQSSHT